MLKGLKKDSKKQTKKQATKQKQPKNDPKKLKQQQDQDTNADLVQINYDQKETAIKNVKKVQNSKLQQKIIDTSNIVIQKKQQKKVITSWVTDQKDIKKILAGDFKLQEHITDFQSLTNNQINKEIAQIAKKQAEQPIKTKVIEQGGIKYATLQNNQRSRQQELVFNKKPENVGFISSIPIQVKDAPVFTNSSQNNVNFAPLQKTAQQIKEEQSQKRTRQQPQLVLKGAKVDTWGRKTGDKKQQVQPPVQFKVSSHWASKGNEVNDAPTMKFAPLNTNETKSNRKQQEFVFVNKKQQQQRRKAKQQQQTTQKVSNKVDVNNF